jgi:hypothetical protein
MNTSVRLFTRLALLSVLALWVSLSACGGPEEPALGEPFIGTWNATSFMVDGQEYIQPNGDFYFVLQFFTDASYYFGVGGDTDGLFCTAPDTMCDDEGDITFTSSTITLDPGTPDAQTLAYSVSGNTMTTSTSIDGSNVAATFQKN